MKKSMLSTKQSYALCAIGVLVLFGILVAVCETGAISLYVKGILMTCCIAVIMTTSLNLTIGVLGQLTLGCCGFEAIGAYSAALMKISSPSTSWRPPAKVFSARALAAAKAAANRGFTDT